MSAAPQQPGPAAPSEAASVDAVVGGARAHRRPSAGIVIPAKPPSTQPLSRRYALGPLVFALGLLLVLAVMVWFHWRRNGETLQDKFRQLGRGVNWVSGQISGLDPDLSGGDDPEERASALRTAAADAIDATREEVQGCFDRFGPADRDYAKAQVFVEVDDAGRVKSAKLRETYGGGLLADCVAHAVVQAEFPKGAWGQITLNYPVPKPKAE